MIRRAMVSDVPRIADLIAGFAGSGQMLFRSHAELYETIRDFFVFTQDSTDRVIGVCALEIVWADLAEIKSLAVESAFAGQGIGRELVRFAIDDALAMKIQKVFVLTYKQRFFEHLGFTVVDKSQLPHKVWGDCLKCPKNRACDEIAMVRELLPEPAIREPNPDSLSTHHYDVPTPLVKLNITGRPSGN